MQRVILATSVMLAVLFVGAGCSRSPVQSAEAQVLSGGGTPPPTGGAAVQCDPARLDRISGMACNSEGASCGVCPKDVEGQCKVLVCQSGSWQPNVVPAVPPGPPGTPQSR